MTERSTCAAGVWATAPYAGRRALSVVLGVGRRGSVLWVSQQHGRVAQPSDRRRSDRRHCGGVRHGRALPRTGTQLSLGTPAIPACVRWVDGGPGGLTRDLCASLWNWVGLVCELGSILSAALLSEGSWHGQNTVQVRMGVALALTPFCDKYLVQPFQGARDEEERK